MGDIARGSVDERLVEDRIKAAMADVLELNRESIRSSTSMENTAAWDSLNHINAVVVLEEEFGLMFSVEEIEAMTSVGTIVRIVKGKL